MLRKILQGVHTHVAKHRKAPQTVIHVAADADTNTSTPMSAWRAHPEHVAQALSQSLQTRTIVPTKSACVTEAIRRHWPLHSIFK